MTATQNRAGADSLRAEIANLAAPEAAARLCGEEDAALALTLQHHSPAAAVDILWELSEERRQRVLAVAPPEWAAQWAINHSYEPDTLGRLMAPAFAVFRPEMTVAEAVAVVRDLVKKTLISYAFVVDADCRLTGVLVFREMMLADPQQRLGDIMIRDPIHLRATTKVLDGMREILKWHFPSYPVCDDAGRIVGVVRGADLFRQQAVELSAQAGTMVGVEKEERPATPWPRSFRFRHPWLQLNLLTAFVAAAVVGVFEDTIDRIIVLAVFLPVLAGQSGNSGSQAMAITLRGMTLGDLATGSARDLVVKEAWLGLVNGVLVGLTAGLGMLVYANWTDAPSAAVLALVVVLAMTVSCILSGVSGVLIPLALRRAGADPASASSIFLTTVTDCISMGLFLGLATVLVP